MHKKTHKFTPGDEVLWRICDFEYWPVSILERTWCLRWLPTYTVTTNDDFIVSHVPQPALRLVSP